MKRKILVIASVILLTPAWMYLAWLFTPSDKLVIAIVDKTVPLTARDEHNSLTWILNNQKIYKTSSAAYKSDADYFGFFPAGNKKYQLKGLEKFNARSLEKLSSDCDMIYYADTYGIAKQEWYTIDSVGLLYGGLSANDLVFLKRAKEKKKLIIAEFNTIGSPTSEKNRLEFESLFHFKWSGWIGRSIETLDINLNSELPTWLVNNYKSTHNGQWPFNKAGVIFVHHSGTVVILQEGTSLKSAVPIITTSKSFAAENNLPEKIGYTYWFEVMDVDTTHNDVPAKFNIEVNESGLSELQQHGLSARFPAIICGKNENAFYYFCADFCDNPVNMTSSYFKGIPVFSNYFADKENPYDRNNFFWSYYRPLMNQLLNKQLEGR